MLLRFFFAFSGHSVEGKGERGMVTGKKTYGKAKPMAVGLAFGVGAALLLTVVFSVAVTQLVLGERIEENAIGYWTGGMLPICTALGSWIAVGLVKRRKMQTCLITGGIYFVCLLGVNVLFFGGQFHGVFVTFLMVLLGATVAGLLAARGEKRGSKKHKKYHSR